MKKILISIALVCLLAVIFVPFLVKASGGLVPCNPTCDKDGNCRGECDICSFFQMLVNIYKFIVFDIATPLAIIALIVGGVFMMISAGNPNLMGTGKKILYAAIIGLFLVFASYLIIDFILNTIGYTQDWSSLELNCSGDSAGGDF